MANGSGKKRKHTEDVPRPKDPDRKQKKKKVQFDDEPSSSKLVKVTSVFQPRVAPPIIASSPGISLPSSVQFRTYVKDKTASKKRSNNGSSGEMLLHASTPKVDYTGKEERPQNSDPHLKHYLCVYDPKAAKMQVVEARNMVVRGAVRSQQAPPEAMLPLTLKKTAMDLRTDLGQTFGTKKAKKAIQSITENAINTRLPGADGSPQKLNAAERAMMDVLQQKTGQMASKDALQATIDSAKPVPRGHFDAEEIQDVYIPEEIIGRDVLRCVPVREWQEAVNAGEAISLASRFVAHRVTRVASHTDALSRLQLLRYLYWLMQFWSATRPAKERGSKRSCPREKLKAEVLKGAPDVVVDQIYRKFTQAGMMRKYEIELLMTHCCVFAAIIDSFQVNTLDLREDLRLEQKQITQYFSEVGARCKVVKSDGKTDHVAVLALPLQFPRNRQKRRK